MNPNDVRTASLDWTEEDFVTGLGLIYAAEGLDPGLVEQAARKALGCEGTNVPIGDSGRSLSVRPGMKRRLRVAER